MYNIYATNGIALQMNNKEQINKLLKETQDMLEFTSWWDKLKFGIKYFFIRIKNYE